MNDLANCRVPLPHQAAAIHGLQNFENATILAWLSLLRALHPGFQHASRPGGLAAQQFDALVTLIDLPDSLILEWLHISHVARQSRSLLRLENEPG